MKFSKVFILALITIIYAALAPIITNNPTNVIYISEFPATGPNQDLHGHIMFSSENGTAKIHVNLKDLPTNEGVIIYHVHAKPIPEGGSCSDTAGHLNPFNANSTIICEKSDPATCEVGDLSGKHGSIINTSTFETTYYDPYISLNPNSSQFIGNLSINIHLKEKNNLRIACANIVLNNEDHSNMNTTSHNSSLSSSSPFSISQDLASNLSPILRTIAVGLAALWI